ncbi:MAG: hypothetical protein ACREB0_11045, partial [Sphingopyxis sp.]
AEISERLIHGGKKNGSRSFYRDPVQGEPKMVISRDPERSVLLYVSTGSAGNHHLQAAMGRISIEAKPPPPPAP